jgi:hypothetical protein
MDFITSDRSLKVGDIVISFYNKGEILFRITGIEKRYLTKDDLIYDFYKNGQVGDEFNPTVQMEAVADLSIRTEPNSKFRKARNSLDAAWVKKIDPAHIQAHIQKLNSLLDELWP